MRLTKYLRRLRRKFKREAPQPTIPQPPMISPISEQPLLVDYPPTEHRDGWQSVDSREGSQSGHEGDWSGQLHQRAPTPAIAPEDASRGVISQTWGLLKEYMTKLLNTDPRPSPSHAASGLHRK